MEGLTQGLLAVFGAQLGGTDAFDRLAHGLLGVVNVTLLDPTFEGPTRQKLASPEAQLLVKEAVVEGLPGYLATQPELAAELRRRLNATSESLPLSGRPEW